MKIDQNGNFVWATDFNGSNIKEYTDIAVDDQNFIYTVGSFKQTVDFLPSGSNVQSHDVFVQKLDENGTQLWAAQFKGVDLNFSGDVSVDSQGNVYVNGAFSDSVDFDPGVLASTFCMQIILEGVSWLSWIQMVFFSGLRTLGITMYFSQEPCKLIVTMILWCVEQYIRLRILIPD